MFRATLQETPQLGITARELGTQPLEAPEKDASVEPHPSKPSAPNWGNENFKIVAQRGRRLALLDGLERTRRREEVSIEYEKKKVSTNH